MIIGLITQDPHPSNQVVYILNGLWALFFVPYFVLCLMYGCGGLDRFQARGPYKVGGKEFWSKSTGCKVLMFYPVDDQEYDKNIGASMWDVFRFPGREEAAIKSMV